MAGQTTVNQIQLGDNATATQNFVLQTNSDGSATLARGNVGATSQDVLTVDASGFVTLTQGRQLTAATAQAATSGTAKAFTGIPSWVKRITLSFNSLQTSGTSLVQVQLGTSGGIVTTGYLSGAASPGGANVVASANSTTGLLIDASNSSGVIKHGLVNLVNITGNIWVMSGTNGRSDAAYTNIYGGSIMLASALTQLRITMVNGTDTFVGGNLNIMYEG